MTSRRDFLRFLGMGAALIAVPQFGRWHRQGPLFVPHRATDGIYNVEIYDAVEERWVPLSGTGEWYNVGRGPRQAVFSDWRAQAQIPGIGKGTFRGALSRDGMIYVVPGGTLQVTIPPVEVRYE